MKPADRENISETMIAFAHDAIFLLDPYGKIIEANPAACISTGFKSEDEIISQQLKFTDLFDHYDLNDVTLPLNKLPVTRALNGEYVIDFKLKSIRKGTGEFWYWLFSAIPLFDEAKKITGAILSIKEISDSIQTEQKLTNTIESEKGLLENDERFRLALMVGNFGFYDYDIINDQTKVNSEYVTMLEYSPDEVQVTLDWWTNSIHPEERDRSRLILDNCIYGKTHDYKMEFRMRTKSGGWKWIRCQGGIVKYDKQGKPARMIGTHTDINDLKQIEERLQSSETFLNSIIDQNPNPMWISDASGNLIKINKACLNMFNLTSDEVIGKFNIFNNTSIEEQGYMPIVNNVYEKGEVARFELVWESKKHKHLTVKDYVFLILDVSIFPIRDNKGKITNAVIQYINITDRKRAEEATEKMRNTLSESQKIAHMGSFEYLVDTQATVWSEEEYHIYGLDPSGPSPVYDVMLATCIHPEDADILNKTFRTALQNSSVYELEHRIIRPDGNVRWIYDRAHPYFDRNGKLLRYVGSSLDITERKNIELKLAERKKFIESIVNMTPDGLYVYDIINKVNVYSNNGIEKILGYTIDEIQSIGSDLIPLLMHPDDYASYKQTIITQYSRAKDNEPIIHEYRMKHKSGEWRWLISNEVIYSRQKDGSPWQIFGLVHDITESKKAEDALRESEYFFKESQRAADIGSYKLDFISGYWKSSEILDQIFGIGPDYERSILNWAQDIIYPDDRATMYEYLKDEVILKHRQFNKEYRIIRKSDNSVRWVSGLGEVSLDKQGTLISMFGTIQDITERKGAEEIRKRLTRELRALSSCNQALIRADNEQILLSEICNIICDIAGYRMAWVGYIVNEDHSYVKIVARTGTGEAFMIGETYNLSNDGKTPIDTAIRNKKSCIIPDISKESVILPHDDYELKKCYHSIIVLPLLDSSENIFGVLTILSGEPNVFTGDELKLIEELAGDLSFGIVGLRTRIERRIAQMDLINEKELSDALIDATPGIFCVMDRTNHFLRMNSNCMNLHGLSRETFGSADSLIYVYKDDVNLLKNILAQLPEVGHTEIDIRFEFKPGEITWWRISAHAVTVADTLYIISTGFDITSRKYMEENLQKALKEKEVLLQELYHRTKNNMQVISAYLSMQSIALNDTKLQVIFNEMENRIRAMALVHEKLYKSKDLTNVDLNDYLCDLTKLLFSGFPGVSNRVSFFFDAEEVFVTMDIAIPIGLVVTELLTNSLKYAFPGERCGKILIQIHKHAGYELTLNISDDGVGAPGHFDLSRKDTLGIPTVLYIIKRQLHGSVELDNSNGFKWKFVFRTDMYGKRV